MNNEIKEILQAMAKIQFHGTDLALENKDTEILLNYITNLQEENEKLKFKVNNLQSKIDKAIEWIYKDYEQSKNEISDNPKWLIDSLGKILEGGEDE